MYDFIRNPKPDLELGFEASVYYVAKHYGMSIEEVWNMSAKAFEQSFVWANAADRHQAEEMEKTTNKGKNKARVGSTHGAMPFSE
mgnify:FL=1